jgi:phage repressor protein C with HTH and peptisase S24 domain
MSWATHLIAELQAGRTVQCRPRGNSMTSRISSGQLCTIAPLDRDPRKDDVVLCKVRGSQYLHVVSAVRGDQFQISNNHGHVNGWTPRKNVYGILTRVE